MLRSVHLCKSRVRRGDGACLLCILALLGEPSPPTKTTRPETLPRRCRAPGPPAAATPDSPYQAPRHREVETSPPHPAALTPRTSSLSARTALLCALTFGALGYVTLRYCTLNNCRGSVHT